jgi:hypothetical protein
MSGEGGPNVGKSNQGYTAIARDSGNGPRYGEFAGAEQELDHYRRIALIAHEDGTDYRSVRAGLPVLVGTPSRDEQT